MEAEPLDLTCRQDVPSKSEKISSASPTVFSCDTCGCVFSGRGPLEKHRFTKHQQTRQGRHYCAHCLYSSDDKSIVTRHERTHTRKRPFICNACGKSFTGRFNLANHSLVHSKEQPHKCVDCGKRFTRKGNLRVHCREQHPGGGGATFHLCSVCGKRFTRISNFNRHRIRHRV